MREKIVAGNWKMNKTFVEAIQLVSDLKSSNIPSDVTVIVAPPFPFLQTVKEQTRNFSIKVAAQNCHTKEEGAFTGEVSAKMLASMEIDYVIIGHSERRAYFHETHSFLKEKVNTVLANHLKPIFCCGENLIEREANHYFEVVKSQLEDSLFHLSNTQFENVVIAYEPVWAIGTGKTATPAQAQEMHAYIRSLISKKYGSSIASSTSILYGGSCNATNASELFKNPDVDGGLIGGASLKVPEFSAIIQAMEQVVVA
jgi:triosephosphate isomerase